MPVRTGGTIARWTRLAVAAVAVAGVACGAVRAEEDRPYYEIAASGETGGPGAAARVELDAAIPLPLDSLPGGALLLQPGALLSQGPDGRTLAGGSLGTVYRFEGAGGIVGLNAFYDANRIFGSGSDRTHHRASVGADYQAGRSRIGANWYVPLSGAAGWADGAARLTEYATGGPELRYRFALDESWTVRGRAFYELDRESERPDGSGAEHGLRLSAGAGYRIGCIRLGLDFEHDTRDGESLARAGLALRFGAAAGCAGAAKPDLHALVEREKVVATRQIVTRQIATRRLVALTRLPDDVTELYEIVPGGAADSDTVWLYVQGGPTDMLEDGTGNVPYTLPLFPGHGERILANVHQVQTYNPDLFEDSRLDSLARLQAEMDVSVEILDRVIRHFKTRGKRVVVFSHSFGSIVLPRYLALKGPGAADRYVIMAGRLDIEEKVYRNRLDKLGDGSAMIYEYGEDGTTLASATLSGDPSAVMENGMLTPWMRASFAFQGALLAHRYTELLAKTDLSKAIYVYGTMDRRLGRLTRGEVDLLEARGARVLAIEGGHTSMIGEVQRIVDAIEAPVANAAPAPLATAR